MKLTPFRALLISCAAFLDGLRRGDEKTPAAPVPRRPGHREKAKQTPKQTGRFRATCRVWDAVKLPAGIKTLRGKPFTHLTRAGGRVYLMRHGTRYRLDKLELSGQVSLGA